MCVEMPRLFTDEWRALDDAARCESARRLLDDAEADCGAVVGLTLDEHRFGRLWTLCLQHPGHSHIEQRCFPENPNPRYYGPDIPQFAKAYDHHWTLRVRGPFAKCFVESLHQAGAWDGQSEPSDVEDCLDGGCVTIFAVHPIHGPCNVNTFTGAVYATGAKGIDIEQRAHRLTRRTCASFRRQACISLIRSAFTRQ